MTKDTVRFGDKDYWLVPARLKKFREEHPRAKVDTNPTYNADGSITFKATILMDKSDEFSPEASGSARYTEAELKKPKQFEKLETIAVGRALANIGYLNDGQVATTEEMLEFEEYKNTKVEEAIDKLNSAETIDDLKSAFLSLGELMAKPEVIEAKDKRKAELNENTKVR